MTGAAARRVTVNEIVRTARRAFAALGAGPGCEREAADAAAWLETRGLAGLAALHADLAVLQRPGVTPFRVLREAPDRLELDGAGGSAVLAAAAAVDWLAGAGSGARLTLAAVRSPQWVLPALARHAARTAAWVEADSGGRTLLRACVDGRGRFSVTLGVPAESLAGCRADLRGGQGRPAAEAPGGALTALDGGALDARHETALRDGVPVPVQRWQAVTALARQALVPASESSRARGAGGGDDNA